MLSNEFLEKLIMLHNDGGKHSNYQNFPKFVVDKFGIEADIDENWRGDSARFTFINDNVSFGYNYKVLDVGANTGRFCLDLAYNNKDSIFYAYELNKNYIECINLIKEEFDLKNVYSEAISVGLNDIEKVPCFDIIFHMNVLHHAGVDFDIDIYKNFCNFKEYSIEYLSKLSRKCNTLIFQTGYNLGGNKNNPIILPNDIKGMIDFEIDIFKNSNFEVEKMALYNYDNKQYVLYENNKFIEKLTSSKCSEFYKRPIFILKSIQKEK